MRSVVKYKQFAILLFVAFAILSIFLLGLLAAQEKNNLLTYLVTILVFVSGLLMFILLAVGLSDKTLDLYCQDIRSNESAELEEFRRIENKTTEKDQEVVQEKEFNTSAILTRITSNLSDTKDLVNFVETLMINISKEYELAQGLFFVKEKKKDNFLVCGKYAYYGDSEPENFKSGETLPGQVAKNKELLAVSNIPDNYATIVSGLGTGSPKHLLFIPFVTDNITIGVMELAFLKTPEKTINQVMAELSGMLVEQLEKRIK
jgi:hypothetical protein